MSTRWQKLREDLKILVDKDKISPAEIPILEKLQNIEFNCGKCEYMTEGKFLCDTGDINFCRQGYANWLNQEVGDND